MAASEVTGALYQISLRQLSKLSLEDLKSLGAAEGRQLAEGAWDHLTHLSVMRCDVTAAAVRVLLSAPWAQQLKHLHLPQNRLGDTGLLLIAQAKLPQLQHLDLQENRLGTPAAAWCLQQLDLPQLTHLNLSRNRIRESGLAGLCRANLPQLRHLNVNETFTLADSLYGLELLARGPWLELEEVAFREEEEFVYEDLAEPEGSTAELEAAVPAEEVSARTSSLRWPPSLSKLTKLDIGGCRDLGVEPINMLTSLRLSTLQHLNFDGVIFTKESFPRLAAALFPDLQLVEIVIAEEAGGAGDIRELDLILALGKGSVWSSEVLVKSLSGDYTIGQIRKMTEGDVSMLQEALEAHRAAWAQDRADDASAEPPPDDEEVRRATALLRSVFDAGGEAARLERMIADIQSAAAKGSHQVVTSEDETEGESGSWGF
jgi:phage FluMu protein gp41